MLTKSARPQAFAAGSSPSPLLAAAISLALASAAANAQTQTQPTKPQTMQKVQVQAEAEQGYKPEAVASPKFTQPLLDTPQTIAVVTKEVLDQQGAASLSDALRNTPGITFLMGENGNTSTGDSIFMRGFDTQGSIFVDNIRDMGTVTRDTFNTEQIEIAKGPAGPDNGRGAASGYVNMATKVPVADDFSDATLRYSSGDSKRFTGDLNQQFGDSGIALRMNAMGQEGGVAGRDYVQKDSWAVAPSLGVGISGDTRAYFYLLHTKQNNIPDGGVPTVGLDGFYNGTLADASADAPRPDRDNFYGAASDFEDIEATMFTARFEHDFSPYVTLRNTSRYGDTEQFYFLTGINTLANLGTAPAFNDPSTWTVSRSRQFKVQDNKLLTNQTNLTANFSTGSVTHSLTSGLEFINEEQYSQTGAGNTTPANLYNPNRNDVLTGAGATLAPTAAYSSGETTTIGLYAFDTIKVGQRWQFTGGVRFDDYDTDFNSITVAAGPTPPAGTLTPLSLAASDTLFSYKVGALFKPVANGSVYLAYATSQLPPGGTNFTLSTAETGNAAINNPNVDPQESTNLELGTKWDLREGALALTAAVFRSENKNDLVQADPTDPAVIQQIGKKVVEGIELGVVGRITDAWQVTAGVAKMETDVVEGSATQAGAQINWSPELTFTSWTTYQFPFGLTVGGGARFVDTVFRSINNATVPATTNMAQAPDYWVIDAVAAYTVNPRFSVQLNGYNLADGLYVSGLNNGGSRYRPGTPRSFALTVNTKF